MGFQKGGEVPLVNIDQEFEPYCEGCEHLDIESEKVLVIDFGDSSKSDRHVIRCSHLGLCRRLWQKWSDTYGTDKPKR